MTNTNCLAGFECPKCKSDGPFRITVQHIVLMYDDGTDIDEAPDCSAEFGNHDPCECPKCGHHCTVIDFKPEERGNGQDFEIEDRSTADLVYMILDTLGDADMTTDDIIDNTRFYAEELQRRFPVRDPMIETLMAALAKIKEEQTI
jgi:hypothetical protein